MMLLWLVLANKLQWEETSSHPPMHKIEIPPLLLTLTLQLFTGYVLHDAIQYFIKCVTLTSSLRFLCHVYGKSSAFPQKNAFNQITWP